MRWLIAGLLFALAVSLAIATAAIRARSVAMRRTVEQQYRAIGDRCKELDRLSYERMTSVSPERLSEMQREWLRREAQWQEGRRQ
jgi:hypothetical protein